MILSRNTQANQQTVVCWLLLSYLGEGFDNIECLVAVEDWRVVVP